MRRDRILRSIASAIIALLALAGCSSSASSNTNYVAVDPVENPAPTGTSATSEQLPAVSVTRSGGDPAADTMGEVQGRPVSAATLSTTRASWDRFLAKRAVIIEGGADVDRIAPYATADAVAQVASLRATNDQLVEADELTGLLRLVEWSNIDTVVASTAGDRLMFVDCTERHRVNVLGRESVVFVTNVVEMIVTADSLKVDRVDTVQNGVIGRTADDLGCVPTSLANRAVQTAHAAVEIAAGQVADPANAGGLPTFFQGEARTTLAFAIDEMSARDLRRPTDEQVRIDAIGIDLNRADFTIVVEVCRMYPTGRAYLGGDGEWTPIDIAAGGSQSDRLLIALDPTQADASSADAVIDITTGRDNCWRADQ